MGFTVKVTFEKELQDSGIAHVLSQHPAEAADTIIKDWLSDNMALFLMDASWSAQVERKEKQAEWQVALDKLFAPIKKGK